MLHDFDLGEARILVEGDGILEPRWSPSGQWVAFRTGDGGLSAASAQMDEVVQIARPAAEIGAFAWSPNNDQLAFVENGDLYLLREVGMSPSLLVDADALPVPGVSVEAEVNNLIWGPNRPALAFELVGTDEQGMPNYQGLWLIEAPGDEPYELLNSAMPKMGPASLAGWTPDGWVLFWQGAVPSDSMAADGLPLFAISPARSVRVELGADLPGLGEQAPPISTVLPHSDFVVLSPNRPGPYWGHVVVVMGGGRGTWTNKRLVLLDPDIGIVSSLTGDDVAASSPSFTPDGRQVAYTAMPDNGDLVGGDGARERLMTRSIWLMDLVSGNSEQLTQGTDYRDEYPLWSAGGKHILFARLDESNQASLWIMSGSSGSVVQVVNELGPPPDWLGYYGHIDWSTYFDWWRPPAHDPKPDSEAYPARTPFPTPSDQAVPWDELTDPAMTEGIEWSEFRARIQSPVKGQAWPVIFRYPKRWVANTSPGQLPISHSVQNCCADGSFPPADFIKFELLWMKDPPATREESPEEQWEWYTVEVSSEPARLRVGEDPVGGARIISAAVELKGRWYQATGYINQKTENPELMRRYSAVILEMISSLKIGE